VLAEKIGEGDILVTVSFLVASQNLTLPKVIPNLLIYLSQFTTVYRHLTLKQFCQAATENAKNCHSLK